MSLSLVALSLAAAPAQPVLGFSPAPVRRDRAACLPSSRHAAGTRALGPRRLVDAPPADLHLAVDRRENGCPVPALAGAPRR